MKKSTLITTIAMIVVVVVALSTATYAWFTTGTQVTMQQTITTVANTGWLLYGGTETTPNTASTTVNYSSTTTPTLNLLDGLWSPDNTIGITFNSNNGTGVTVSGKANMYQAKQLTSTTAASDSGASYKAPGYVRVINGATTPKTLQILIYVIVADDTNDGAFYAADAFQTYVSWSGSNVNSANTPYNKGSIQTTTTGDGAGYYEATKGQAENAARVLILPDEQTTPATRNINNAVVTDGYRTGAAVQIADGVSISASQYWYAIGITIGELGKSEATNLAIYSWLDGWMVDNSAANVNFSLVYQFGDDLFHTVGGVMTLGAGENS